MAEEKDEVLETQRADGAEIRDTDIVFDCPHCSKTLVIDYRGAGLQISCAECGRDVLVPIPDGMELTDEDKVDGTLFTVTFKIKDLSATGKYEVKLSYYDGDITDENYEPLDVNMVNGYITIK